MNPILQLQSRLRDILTPLPELAGATLLIEDRAGIDFDIESALATLEAPLLTLGAAQGRESSPVFGANLMKETIVLSLFLRPLAAGEASRTLPTDVICAIRASVHCAPVAAGTRGGPHFRVEDYRLADATDGVVRYEISVTAPTCIPMQSVPTQSVKASERQSVKVGGLDAPATALPAGAQVPKDASEASASGGEAPNSLTL